ncbi:MULTISPECIES: DUF4136 domain-containing protein [Sphingomonas]|uniref:DUF4136 domain-containing protein n=1 Tax=Sphingomonas adhaesiva TaxID=28212 RepID=A0A2A4I8S9_9SPHN|nr:MULTISPECIES: DUF4136 domain-containing protein [Sphingomonas]PCG14193.1 DUF4136 domain-containing protein [Sphingomonas adhaesiva]PZU76042.1 MAG: DUF4136 domain-containing protein [Sphingomonas sp.]
MRRAVLFPLTAALALSACATGPQRFPVEATRFHYDAVTQRGTVSVEPLPGASSASLEYKTYAAAVQAELLKLGFTNPAPGTTAQFIVTVGFTRTDRALPPRRSPITIGLGGGVGGGGWRSGGGVGGGVSFPVGGSGAGRGAIVTELAVRIRQGGDAIWEGQAQSLTDTSAPDADVASVAARLASALFKDFPGESGRTIEVK